MTEDNKQALAGAASELNAELGFCCQFCGSDANERDELFKSEREINRLQSELSLLKRIISRVSDELNLPTENGNRVHDLQFWLDSPKIEIDNDILKKKLLPTWLPEYLKAMKNLDLEKLR